MSNIDNLNLQNGANNNELDLNNDSNNSNPNNHESCCGSSTTAVEFKTCELCKTAEVNASLDCAARLLTVKVKVVACKGKTVIVSVKVYNKANEKLIRFKAKEIQITGDGDDCNDNTVEFCFSFVNDACAEKVEEYDIVSNAEYVFTGNC